MADFKEDGDRKLQIFAYLHVGVTTLSITIGLYSWYCFIYRNNNIACQWYFKWFNTRDARIMYNDLYYYVFLLYRGQLMQHCTRYSQSQRKTAWSLCLLTHSQGSWSKGHWPLVLVQTATMNTCLNSGCRVENMRKSERCASIVRCNTAVVYCVLMCYHCCASRWQNAQSLTVFNP